MNRIFSVMILVLLVLTLVSCKDTTPSTPTTTLPTKTPIETVDGKTATNVPETTVQEWKLESVDYSRDGDFISVNVNGNMYDTELGILILTSKDNVNRWHENKDALIDLGQIHMGADGKGSATLTVDQEISEFVICITYQGGEYVLAVGGQS